ncbi:MAG TPA: selenium-dependent xanthine dehydrogenase [Fastidiosipila sp.]|nr:selenium-dependent xanthine dehydrogenase [Fastidiosipila sp.]
MFKLTVNGLERTIEKDMRLIDYLRDELRLTSVKDGCSSGACGTCTVLVDGKKVKTCVQKVSRFDGKSIVTVEGLSQREKDVYVNAFSDAGAVQCGFCIPGMVIAAKALIDENPDPTPEDVKKAIHGNICRCTGYVKIEDAIMRAAKMLRGDKPLSENDATGVIGSHFFRIDAPQKVLGTGQYVDDIELPNMIYAKALRSKYPRARVDAIRIDKALEHPDCVKILKAEDVPFNKTGHIIPDWDVLIAVGDTTRYIGDAIVLVASRNKYTLDEILDLVEVDYTELTPLTSPREALAEDAPKIHENGNLLTHEKINRGDVEKAIKNSAHVVTRTYHTPMTDHAFMEPECAIAIPEGDNRFLLYTASQSVYDEQHEISRMLQLPPENIRSRAQLVGGGFGGKEDMSVQHHAALMAYHTGVPVKVKFSRQESIDYHVKRHAMEMEVTTACDENGKLTATKAVIYSDCGAYASLGGPVLQRACTHAGGPYQFDHFKVDGYCVYTNNVPGGAYRGFGVTQSCFAQEQNLNLLAEKVGLDPWEFRHLNAIRPGQSLPNGQIAGPETAFVECLEAVKDAYYKNANTGIAGSMKNSGIGVGLTDIGRANLVIMDGIVHLRTSAADIGQGIFTIATQIVCETAGIPAEAIVCEAPDTLLTPDSGTTTASRQTLFCGEAARVAATQLRAELDAGKTLADLDGQTFIGEYSGVTDKLGSDKPHPVSHIAYSYGVQVVTMDDDKKVSAVSAAYDVGKVINPALCEGQVEGGVAMGLGFALTENLIMEDGYVKSKYATLGLFRSTQMPPIDVHLVERADYDQLAFGAKGIGEIASIPTAPAVAGALYKMDGKERLTLPLEDTFYDRKAKK